MRKHHVGGISNDATNTSDTKQASPDNTATKEGGRTRGFLRARRPPGFGGIKDRRGGETSTAAKDKGIGNCDNWRTRKDIGDESVEKSEQENVEKGMEWEIGLRAKVYGDRSQQWKDEWDRTRQKLEEQWRNLQETTEEIRGMVIAMNMINVGEIQHDRTKKEGRRVEIEATGRVVKDEGTGTQTQDIEGWNENATMWGSKRKR